MNDYSNLNLTNTLRSKNNLSERDIQRQDSATFDSFLERGAITNVKIADASITNAKINDASITNAKINDVAADKITAGTLDIAVDIGTAAGGAYVRLDGANNRIIVNDGTTNRIVIGNV